MDPGDDVAVNRALNGTTVTMAYLARLGPAAGREKLVSVVRHNLEALRGQIAWVAGRPPLERAFRIVSDVLPAYNHPDWRATYQGAEMRALVEGGLAAIGRLARAGDIRVSTHPEQFCVLGTLKDSARENAIRELEYHADLMEMLGYGAGWHPAGAHVNVHGGAREAGIEGFKAGLARVSDRVRNLVTIENDEVSFGLDDVLPLAGELPIVLDLHHHWIHSRGEYIEPDDPRIRRVQESWRGVRPMSHVSVSREDVLIDHDATRRPDFAALTGAGIKAHHLRGHSNMMWNAGVNALVARHLAWTDFEVEAKHKNLASGQLARFVEAEVDRGNAGIAAARRAG